MELCDKSKQKLSSVTLPQTNERANEKAYVSAL